MKFTIAPLLILSPVLASKAAKYGKANKAGGKFSKAKASKSAYGSMSASMSIGPEPPITLTGCGESFTDQKVVLSDNLDCGPRDDDVGRQLCAVILDGPQAELDCKDKTLSQVASSQVASSPQYLDGPFSSGICLKNGAKAINCNVQRFYYGISVTDGGEVVNSNLGSNNDGIFAFTDTDTDATLTIEDT